MGDKKSAGTMTWIGQIKDETLLEVATLVLISPQVSYQLKVSYWNSDSLSGFAVDVPYGKFPVELKRVK